MLNVLKNYIDSRTYNNFSKMDVSDLLKKHNMEIVDFSDYKGMTYFCSRTK